MAASSPTLFAAIVVLVLVLLLPPPRIVRGPEGATTPRPLDTVLPLPGCLAAWLAGGGSARVRRTFIFMMIMIMIMI